MNLWDEVELIENLEELSKKGIFNGYPSKEMILMIPSWMLLPAAMVGAALGIWIIALVSANRRD